MRQLFTIGYEGADVGDVLDMLVASGVETLVDVRAVALSRRPGFSKRSLATATVERGLAYLHLRDLGDPKEGRIAARAGDYESFRRVYAAHLETAAGRTALAELQSLVARGNACLLCFERDAIGCHRAMICDKIRGLRRLGVVHLRPEPRARIPIRTLHDPHQGGPTLGA